MKLLLSFLSLFIVVLFLSDVRILAKPYDPKIGETKYDLWMIDYDKAREKAIEQNKLIFILFTKTKG